MPLIIVEVTKEDLKRKDLSPVCVALSRHLNENVHFEVSVENLYMETDGPPKQAAQVDWSGNTQHFLSQLDAGQPVPPFVLEVYIPDEFLDDSVTGLLFPSSLH